MRSRDFYIVRTPIVLEDSKVSVPMVIYPWLPVSFSSATEAILFGIVYFAWCGSEIIGAFILPRFRNRRNGVKLERKDRGSGYLVTFGIMLSIIVVIVFSQINIAPLPEWVFYPGIVLMIAGIVLRQWSIAILGRFFSVQVSVQEGQTIVRTGPYRFIRHPSYTGTLLTLTGLGLAVQSWGAILLLLLVFGIVYGYRIPIEEKVLVTHIGEEYIAYMNETKMLLPFIF